MLLAILLSIHSSLFWKSEYYVMDNYDTITHNIPCEEVGSVCFEKSKVEYVKFDFVDNINYAETHYYTNKVEYRFERLKKYYYTKFESYNCFESAKTCSFYDEDFDYLVRIDTIPDFVGKSGKCVLVTKTLRYFK